MTEPILSYKRPSSRVSSSTPNSPTPPQSSTHTPTPQSEYKPTSRKISSRRQALQDFYNISPEAETPKDILPQPDELDQFIKTANIQDILKLRNKITHTLNSQDSAKKSIIYDNYYELIKLSDTLLDLSKQHQEEVGLEIFRQEEKQESKEEFIDSVLSDLHEFIIEKETQVFNRPFEEIVSLEERESSEVLAEVNSLLQQQDKEKIVDAILDKLSNDKHELLILQLNKLKQNL